MKKISLLILLIYLVAAATATGAISPARQADGQPGCRYDLTGETIYFHFFGDLSNVYAFITQPALTGFQDAIAEFNQKGGICGAQIAMEYRDTNLSQDAAQAIWDEFSADERTKVLFLINTEDAELLREQAAEQKIPLVVANVSTTGLYGDDYQTPGWVFSITPPYEGQLGAFCAYISEHWPEYGIEGDPVIGHVSWMGAFGEASDTPESRAYCESLGIGYAGARYYFPGIPDLTTQVQALLDNGANILYTTSLASGPANLAITLDSLGEQDGVLMAGPNWVLDTSVITLGGQAVKGFVGQLPYIWWDESEHPGIQQMTAYWEQHHLMTATNPEEAFQLRNIAYLIGWAAVDLYRQVAIDAINTVGFENFSGDAIYHRLISGTAYVGLDGLMTIQYDENRRSPNQTRFGQIQFNQTEAGVEPRIVPLTDWRTTPDLIPGGADAPD